MSQTIIFFTRNEWAFSKKEPKPSAIKFSCLSLCEAERRSEKKGFFVFLGGRKKRTADRVRAFIKRRQVTHWCDHVSASLCLGGLWPDQLVAVRSKTQEWKKDKMAQRNPPVDGLEVTLLLQDCHAGRRDLIQVSFLEHLDGYHTKGSFLWV